MWSALSDERTGLSFKIAAGPSKTHDRILLSQIRDSPNLEGRSPYLYLPRTGWPGYTPGHWFLFFSPPTTRRATVELSNPPPRGGLRTLLTLRSTVRATLRLEIYRQSIRLGAKPLETHYHNFFLQLNPCGHSPYVTSSLTRRWVCLLWIGFAFVKCTYRIYSMLLKILLCALYTSPLSVQALQSRSCISYLCYNGSLVTWTVVSLTAAKFKPLIFSMSRFVLSYAANMFILMILYGSCLLPAEFCYVIVSSYV
jgi:hypothetical protein